MDMMLNYRQSGHPGGSRSKVHALVATTLGGAMRWDIRRPEHPFADRFILVAGHCAPLVYATLPIYHEALREMYKRTGDARYQVKDARERALYWEDLMGFRHHGGLAGHAEFEGKTMFFKFNTGPSGHGTPPAAGEAMALMRAGLSDVRVFALEGEGGHSAGANHETKNAAWGLGLSNLCYLLDWNDYGIDSFAHSSVVHGTPADWFAPYGWRIHGAEKGSEWAHITPAILEMVHEDDRGDRPGVAWFKTRKGRGYGKYDNASHGSPHKTNSKEYWETKRVFAEKYGVQFEGFGEPAPEDPAAFRAQVIANYQKVIDLFHSKEDTMKYLADRLVELGESVPEEIPGFKLGRKGNPLNDPKLFDFESYPAEIWKKPGEKAPNRAALASFGSWINSYCKKHYDQPLVLAMSADLADSTNISGFCQDFGEMKNFGRYQRDENPDGCLLPMEITEFSNAGISAGISAVNMAKKPTEEFLGFYSACSTYGSFSYLKYGPLRLFSQMSQDCELKLGKVIWVAGHSGPETADDSRTHFGIFGPGVTQLFPDGHVCDLHPFEYNEVPVMLATALKGPWPIVALHLTRPPVEIPDREKLGMGHYFEAAKGAYVLRDYRKDQPKGGCIFVQGTMSTANTIAILPELDKRGLNVKIVAAVSPQLFAAQTREYQDRIISQADKWDSTFITNRSRRLFYDWIYNPLAAEYALSSDHDDRWRTGGTLDEVIAEAGLDPASIVAGIERFVRDRDKRMARLSEGVNQARA
ncbi:MAG TPA: transketolase [Candidatus Krumholzibacteria bacterium]|nr:transketolase [Candidatus Krumholzibacteria bacterium]